MTISKTLHLSLAKANIHIPVDTEPDMLGRVIEAAERQRTETQRRVRLGLPIGNVRLSEWERVTLKRGPNKGKTAWKKGNRYFHGEKPPEGRGSKQEAGTKGKPAPKPKADKMTPQAMVEKHKAIMAKGSTSHDDMQGFVDDLLTMTVKDINEVKKSLGLKASGKKAELAKKIGQKAFELVGKGKPAEVKKTEPAKPEPKPKQPDSDIGNVYPDGVKPVPETTNMTPEQQKKNIDNIKKAYDRAAMMRTNESGLVPIYHIYDQMKSMGMNPNADDIRYSLQQLEKDKKIELRKLNEKSEVSKEDYEKGSIGKRDAVFHFVLWRKDKPESKSSDKNIDAMSPGELYKYAKELGITPGKSKPQNMKLIKDHLGKDSEPAKAKPDNKPSGSGTTVADAVKPVPKESKLSPEKQAEFKSNIDKAFQRSLKMRQSESGYVSVAQLYDQLKGMGTNPDPDEIRYALSEMAKNGEITLHAHNGVHKEDPKNLAKGAIKSGERVYYFAALSR